MKKSNLDIPERPDAKYTGNLLKELFSQRVAIISILLICLALIGVILSLINRPIPIAIVNESSGQTFFSSAKQLEYSVLEKQLLYYSRQFCEDYFGRNHVTVRDARKRAIDMMHPNMAKDVQKTMDAEIMIVLKEMWDNNFTWNVTVVTEKRDPRYSVFCQFVQILNRPGYEPVKKSHNIKLDWGRLVNNPNPFERPHSLVLLKVQELDPNSEEFKKQLNLSF